MYLEDKLNSARLWDGAISVQDSVGYNVYSSSLEKKKKSANDEVTEKTSCGVPSQCQQICQFEFQYQ